MSQVPAKDTQVIIRPVQYRDLETVERLYVEDFDSDNIRSSIDSERPFKVLSLRPWNSLTRVFGLLLKPLKNSSCTYLAEQASTICGVIRVSPFNRTRSTWRVDRVAVNCNLPASENADSETGDESLESNLESRPVSLNSAFLMSVHFYYAIALTPFGKRVPGF